MTNKNKLAEAYVAIAVDQAALKTGLAQSKTDFTAFFSNIQGLAAKVGIAFTLGATVKHAIDLAANMEKTRIAFNTIIKDIDKTNDLMAKLKKFADVTPFTDEDVIRAGQALVQANVPLQDIEATLKRIGDLASGGGGNFQELIGAWVKLRGQGKVTGEVEERFLTQRVSLRGLAEQIGITGEQWVVMREKGRLTFDMINDMLEKATTGTGMFANSMEKQSESLLGIWSTLTSKVDAAMLKMGEAALPALKIVVERLTKLTESNQLQDFVGTMTDGLAFSVDVVRTLTTSVESLANLISGDLTAATQSWTDLLESGSLWTDKMKQDMLAYIKSVNAQNKDFWGPAPFSDKQEDKLLAAGERALRDIQAQRRTAVENARKAKEVTFSGGRIDQWKEAEAEVDRLVAIEKKLRSKMADLRQQGARSPMTPNQLATATMEATIPIMMAQSLGGFGLAGGGTNVDDARRRKTEYADLTLKTFSFAKGVSEMFSGRGASELGARIGLTISETLATVLPDAVKHLSVEEIKTGGIAVSRGSMQLWERMQSASTKEVNLERFGRKIENNFDRVVRNPMLAGSGAPTGALATEAGLDLAKGMLGGTAIGSLAGIASAAVKGAGLGTGLAELATKELKTDAYVPVVKSLDYLKNIATNTAEAAKKALKVEVAKG